MSGPHESLFSAVRDIPAANAAERLNIKLYRRGARSIALCPFHSEDTPSLTFYPDGHFYCFGCHEHGRAIELYQRILNLSPYKAAQALAEDFNIELSEKRFSENASASSRGKPSAYDLKRVLENYKSDRWRRLCDKKHDYLGKASEIADKIGNPEICAESDEFWEAVQKAAVIQDELYILEDASAKDLLRMAGGTDERS